MNGFFITGTDTDIGKTALSALLLAQLRKDGVNAAPMKPAQTGCEGDGVPDLDYSLSMAQMTVPQDHYNLMSPSRFEPACSPHLAAEQAGTEIEPQTLINAAHELAETYERVIVEGAGGILVPINRKVMMLDLMKALNLPVILAARPGLGTINHTLLSLQALRFAGLSVAGVVFVASTPQPAGFIEEDNRTVIEQLGDVRILGTIPYCEALRDPHPIYDTLPVDVVAETVKIVNDLTL
jgi:dethiobiotin synthetase